MTEALFVLAALVMVAGIGATLLIARAILNEMGGQVRALTEAHSTQVAALVDVLKTPPGFAAFPSDPELTAAEIDNKFAEDPASVVGWDSSLQPIPHIDE